MSFLSHILFGNKFVHASNGCLVGSSQTVCGQEGEGEIIIYSYVSNRQLNDFKNEPKKKKINECKKIQAIE